MTVDGAHGTRFEMETQGIASEMEITNIGDALDSVSRSKHRVSEKIMKQI